MTADLDPKPLPLPTFDALPLSKELRQAVNELGYIHPSPVQLAVFEPATRGRDLVVQARTGTGKTAAFGLPLADSLVRRQQKNVQALVLCPTRELALQVKREISSLCKYRELVAVPVYGGAPMAKQVAELSEGAQILVGTPGRVLDHLERGTFNPKDVRVVILDESDEMLSMGFLPQINAIFGYLPESRQTLLFSATLPSAIQRMAQTRLKNPEFITLSGDSVGALEIQHILYLTHGDKLANLIQVIEVENPESAIVFCNTRDETKRACAALQAQGFDAEWLNADLPQKDRERVLGLTREGKVRFLVATDVAARGIDISHLTHVINHDFPDSPENYVHRTGRTGRAGRTGTAISLVSPSQIGNLYMMRLTYGIPLIEKQLPSARELRTRSEMDVVEMFVAAASERRPHADDLALARRLLTHEQAERVVAGLLREHLGARPETSDVATAARRAKLPPPAPVQVEAPPVSPTAAHSPAAAPRATASPANGNGTNGNGDKARQPSRERPREPYGERTRDARPRQRRDRGDREEFGYTVQDMPEASGPGAGTSSSRDASSVEGPEAEVFVNLGRRDGVEAEALVTLLRNQGLTIGDSQAVRVRDRHTFVSVQREQLAAALAALDGSELAGKTARAEQARR
ncbi:MAG: DEAD/DEAH box helicase [Polyangiaceae bacterium]|nr:DEAD/DEAH box helicase [Polyangiaceae bacterium]